MTTWTKTEFVEWKTDPTSNTFISKFLAIITWKVDLYMNINIQKNTLPVIVNIVDFLYGCYNMFFQ